MVKKGTLKDNIEQKIKEAIREDKKRIINLVGGVYETGDVDYIGKFSEHVDVFDFKEKLEDRMEYERIFREFFGNNAVKFAIPHEEYESLRNTALKKDSSLDLPPYDELSKLFGGWHKFLVAVGLPSKDELVKIFERVRYNVLKDNKSGKIPSREDFLGRLNKTKPGATIYTPYLNEETVNEFFGSVGDFIYEGIYEEYKSLKKENENLKTREICKKIRISYDDLHNVLKRKGVE